MESNPMNDGISNHDLYEMIYGPDEPIDLPTAANTIIPSQMSSPSAPTFIPTPTLNNIDPNQNDDDDDQLLDWDFPIDDNVMIVDNYLITTPNASMSSSADHVTTNVDMIPPTTSAPVMLLDNLRALEDTIYWDQPELSSKIHAPSFTTQTQTQTQTQTPSFTTQTQTQTQTQTTMTAPAPAATFTNRDWIDSSFSSTIFNYQGNSSSSSSSSTFQGENALNQLLYDHSMNMKQKQPLSCKNWPVLTLPIVGKLTDKPTHKPQKPPNFSQPPSQTQTQSNSTEWKKEKRLYKMPMTALKNDVWSWRKYGEKSVDGSPYPRVYYKCDSSKECTAKRRVEQNKSDPNLVCLKYTGHHNHQIPMFMVSSSDSGNEKNNPNSPSGTTEKKKDESIYGLGNFVDLEKNKS